jgi:hypothetical protein
MSKNEKQGLVPLDEEGVLYEAKKTELQIDNDYQRAVNKTRVETLAQMWSWAACGVLIVAERSDHTLWVIDGQHRLLASMLREDIKNLPCLVFKSLGIDDEALAFYRINAVRKYVSAHDKLKALVTGKDRLSLDVMKTMEEQGYKPSATYNVAYTVPCIAAFVSAMKSNRGVFVRVWPLIARLHEGVPIKKPILDVVLYLGKFANEDISSPLWTERILTVGLEKIDHTLELERAKAQHSSRKGFALAAMALLNKGHRTARLSLREEEE